MVRYEAPGIGLSTKIASELARTIGVNYFGTLQTTQTLAVSRIISDKEKGW